jgi:hypothetical protein
VDGDFDFFFLVATMGFNGGRIWVSVAMVRLCFDGHGVLVALSSLSYFCGLPLPIHIWP